MNNRRSLRQLKIFLLLLTIPITIIYGQACSTKVQFQNAIPIEASSAVNQQDTPTTVSAPAIVDTPAATEPPPATTAPPLSAPPTIAITNPDLPSVTAEFIPPYFKEADPLFPNQDSSVLTIITKSVNSVTYACISDGVEIATGTIENGSLVGEKTITIPFNNLKTDVDCKITSITSWDQIKTIHSTPLFQGCCRVS